MAMKCVNPILKHIITYTCPRQCSYCINQYIKAKILSNYSSIEKAYEILCFRAGQFEGHGHQYFHIAITGGEPTLLPSFRNIATEARKYFKKVSLWTQNEEAVTWQWLEEYFDDIVLSVHQSMSMVLDPASPYSEGFPMRTKLDIPVYIGLLADNYIRTAKEGEIEKHFFNLGYAGMTIREEYPNGRALQQLLPSYQNFPVRLVKKEDVYCGYALLPNLNYVECK